MCKGMQMPTKERLGAAICSILCDYKSVRYVKVREVKLSIVYWITVVIVFLYVVLFTIVYEKGYQASDAVSGTTSIKLKGSGSIGDESGPYYDLIPLDAMDLVQPSIEENAFFVVTARSITPNQTQQLDCEGNADVPECSANDTSLCEEALYSWNSQGIFTGNCSANGRCEMYSWCPLENDTNADIINNVGAFTAFVKVDINFETFDVSRNNYYDKYGDNPTYDYNLFSIDDMLSEATDGEVNATDVAEDGAIVLVTSHWDCNLDRGVDRCNPTFSFERIDGHSGTISSGFNFRTVTYGSDGQSRYLAKLMGIRFVFATEGIAGKFNMAALSVTLGAGLAYLGVAAIIADFVLEGFLEDSDKYKAQRTRDLQAMTPEELATQTTTPDDEVLRQQMQQKPKKESGDQKEQNSLLSCMGSRRSNQDETQLAKITEEQEEQKEDAEAGASETQGLQQKEAGAAEEVYEE